jgi:hypothetical protein
MIGCICCHGPLNENNACPVCDFSDLETPATPPHSVSMTANELVAKRFENLANRLQEAGDISAAIGARSWAKEARAASAPAPAPDREEVFKAIDDRLADLREANEIFRKDSRLSAQDGIHRNDREIRFLKDLRSEVILAALPSRAVVGWQPIESAPKDGTRIQAGQFDGTEKHFRQYVCFWNPGWKGVEGVADTGPFWQAGGLLEHPSHWMPQIPAPPTSHASQQRAGDDNA